MVRIRIPGRPIPLARHRHFKGGTFDPQAKDKVNYVWLAKSLVRSLKTLPGPLEVELIFRFTPPKSWSLKRKQEARGKPVSSTPDLSNLVKFTEDALNGVLWEDDRLITKISAQKVYDTVDCTDIFVRGFTPSNGES